MKKLKINLFVLCLVLFTAGAAKAGVEVYGFENGRWGFNGSSGDLDNGPFSNSLDLINDDGKSAPCLKIRGFHGVGLSVARPGFTGNFKTLDIRQISMDIKVTNWSLISGQPEPVAKIFILPASGMSPWVKDAEGFTVVTDVWQHILVDINPDWTDAQAQAAGWHVVTTQGAPSKSFKDTIENVFATGLWLRVHNAGYANTVLIDNYTIGLPGSTKTIYKAPTTLKMLNNKNTPKNIKQKQ